MFFDVKLDAGFTQKARLLSDGNKQDTPGSMTYQSILSCDSVIIMLTLAALINMDLQTSDVQNANLNANPKERVYFYSGTDFGNN